jgi:hypothetical protein
MARKRDRIFALVLAVLFFAFSFGASFYVIYQLYKDHKEAKNVNQTTTADNTSKPQSNSKLEGTKLAGFTPVARTDQLQILDTKVPTWSLMSPCMPSATNRN